MLDKRIEEHERKLAKEMAASSGLRSRAKAKHEGMLARRRAAQAAAKTAMLINGAGVAMAGLAFVVDLLNSSSVAAAGTSPVPSLVCFILGLVAAAAGHRIARVSEMREGPKRESEQGWAGIVSAITVSSMLLVSYVAFGAGMVTGYAMLQARIRTETAVEVTLNSGARETVEDLRNQHDREHWNC